MNISFQGFKNTGVFAYKSFDMYGSNAKSTALCCELTNDIKGKDLDHFSPILKKFTNLVNHNFLKLEYLQFRKKPDSEETIDAFLINDNVVPVDKENLHIYGPIARLFNRILNTPEKILL